MKPLAEDTLSFAEVSLVPEEQRYRGIFEHAIEGIFQTTSEGRYLGANPALARIYGYESAEDLRASLQDISRQLYVKPTRRAEFLREMACTEKVTNFESQVYRRDRSIIWISENAVTVRDDLGRLLYYEGFVVDVTARRTAEDNLKKARAELEHSLSELKKSQEQIVQTERLRAIGEMVTGIAHDFNNALALILGYGELLHSYCREKPAAREGAEYAQMIVTAALEAADVVERLREFHRPPAPGETHVPLSLNDSVEQAIAFSRPRWEAESRARGTPVEMLTDLELIPPVAGNAAELREMLTHLIFNAVDAMPQGGTIIVRTRASGEKVELVIADSGSGMTPEVQRRCLEPFFSTKGENGSGMGLATVYGIVERHGGTVRIDSRIGHGTTFFFSFPIDESGAAAAADTVDATARPLRILLVDDQPVQCELLALALQRDWHDVAAARHGREALEKLERTDFDLVITDKAMPEMNGDQLAAAIKGRHPEVRVIMLTGFGSPLEGSEGVSEFVDLLVTKPASHAEMKAAIARVMK